MGLILRLFALAGLLLTVTVLGAVGIAGYLLFAGGGSRPDCAAPPAGILEQVTRSLAFDAKMAAFIRSGGRLPSGGVGFDESEAQARAERYFDGQTERISDVALCFEDGKATGFARVETALGRKLGVKAEGTLDLSGPYPEIRLSSVSAAGIGSPGFLRGEIEDLINDQLRDIVLAFPLDLRLAEDAASVSRP